MSKNAAAQQAQGKTPFLKVVQSEKMGINPKIESLKVAAEEAEVVTPEVETVSIFDVIEKVNAQYNSGERILPSEAARRAAEEVTATGEAFAKEAAPEAPKVEKVFLSIEDIKRKNEVLSRLTAKWDALAEKRRRVENFAISHDSDTANVIVKDANGEVFDSNSPKTIGKLIEFWKSEFSEAIAQVEKEMREIA